MSEAERIILVTRKMHALAASPEGALLTLVELERLATEQIATEQERPRARDRADS